MNFSPSLLIYTFLAVVITMAGAALVLFIIKRNLIKEAEVEASEILLEARNQFEIEEKEREGIKQEIELESWSKIEDQHLTIEEHAKELEEEIQNRKSKYEISDKELRSSLLSEENDIRLLSLKLQETEKSQQKVIAQLNEQKLLYKKGLLQKTNLEEKDVIDLLKQQLINDTRSYVDRSAENYLNETKEFVEAKAKRILALTIDRFSKEMSTERHIASTFFPDERIREMFCKNLKVNLEAIRELTGCDVIIDEVPIPERLLHVQVIGYDPVRRELTRRLFERIFNDCEKRQKIPTPQTIKISADLIRTELLRQIKKDGDFLSKELGLADLNPEIKQVMGSLRYRYSYTQNQYFHCGEVGWFASLLMSELNVKRSIETKIARRAGFLHDLGKALDHEIDGSHAVIGADFIAARKESEQVVHAVRAHHYDVQPDQDLDFLVIAADAISGGRPGARRSTMESYTQKVTGLQEIAKRYNGVTDVFILNGGRECRVLVNSRVVDDLEALKMSGLIAKTIEDEMQYPGQIKVVVVRETVTSESRQPVDGKRDYRR